MKTTKGHLTFGDGSCLVVLRALRFKIYFAKLSVPKTTVIFVSCTRCILSRLVIISEFSSQPTLPVPIRPFHNQSQNMVTHRARNWQTPNRHKKILANYLALIETNFSLRQEIYNTSSPPPSRSRAHWRKAVPMRSMWKQVTK